jgi:hypothetical protein
MKLNTLNSFVLNMGCAFALLSLDGIASAADKYSVGLNTQLIQEYYWSLTGTNCKANSISSCPGNAQPLSLDQISGVIYDLAANQHVTTFREIVPFELLAPDGTNDPTGAPMSPDSTDITYYSKYLDPVIKIFEKYNVHLILAIGDPVPDWAAPWAVQANGNQYGCFLPTTNTVDFNTFKNNLSWSVGNYLNHLQTLGVTERGRLAFRTWMSGTNSGGLWIEGWNEWTNNYNYEPITNCTAETPINTGATPQRAALLEGGIWYVANYYNVTVKYAAPSIATDGVGAANWYESKPNSPYEYGGYYYNGGVGAPNVHLYGPSNVQSWSAAVSYFDSELPSLINVLPSPYNTQIIVGEIGYPVAVAGNGCTGPGSMDPADWAAYNSEIAQQVIGGNPQITSAVQLLAFWRLDQYAQTGCQATFGVVAPPGQLPTYNSAGSNLFQALGGSGVYSQPP